MDYHKKVRKWYREAVRTNHKADPALRDMLLNSISPPPRVEVMLTNLENELKTIQAKRLTKGRKPVALETVKATVTDIVKMFMSGMELEAKRRYETDIERSKREREASDLADIEKTIAGEASGIFEEGGVVFNEDRKDQVIPQGK